MRESVCEIPIVGHENEAFAVPVKSTNGMEVSRLGNKFPDGLPTDRIIDRRDHVSGFVQSNVGKRLSPIDAIAIKGDHGRRGIGTLAQHSHASIHPDTPCCNEFFTGAPRSVSSLRQNLLKSFSQLSQFLSLVAEVGSTGLPGLRRQVPTP
jgi:hypothetical protein